MITIQAPTRCPSCDSDLEWSNHLLYCRSPSCETQVDKKIEHFTKTLKIKGFGPATISKLDMLGIEDIYTLSADILEGVLSSVKNANKLISEIENSKKAPLNLLLPAFSIPLIGQTAAQKLSTTCNNVSDITEDNCRRAGLGPKATANLLDWVNNMFPLYDSLPLNFKFEKPTGNAIKGIVCISGKLVSFKTKAQATEALTTAGYAVKGSITKDVTILINESGENSAKTQTAQSKGILIVDNLQQFLGEI